MRLCRPTAALLVALALAACAGDDVDPIDDPRPAEAIYAEAQGQLAEGDAADAAATFENVERLHPYSPLAREAMIEAAAAYYEADQADRARLAAERFLSLYPADPRAPEAQYLIALSHYDKIVDVGRDQGETRKALSALRDVITRYPDSDYAQSAKLKYDLARDHLAGKEMTVGRYYLKRGLYPAAINRFRTVVESYQTTTQAPEALYRLTESYLALGAPKQAQTAAAVLGHNYPSSDWYARAYALLTGVDLLPEEDENSWISRAWRQVVLGSWL